MSNQYRLVSAILDDVSYRADIQGQLDRHPTVNLLRLFNESVQQLRVRKVNLGFEGYLTHTAPAALKVTPVVAGETYSEEDWPKDACNIYGVHVLFETGLWLPLKPISFSGVRDYQRNGAYGSAFSTNSTPRAYALRQAPLNTTSSETVGAICITPLPNVARQFQIFYLQSWPDAASTDTFNGFAGDIEWIIWDMVAKISCRDNDSSETYQISVAERQRIEMVFQSSVPRTNIGVSIEPRRADDYGYDEWAIRAIL